MLRFLFLFLLAGGQVFAPQSATAQSISPSIAVEQRGENVYLLGSGFHTVDTGTGRYTLTNTQPPLVSFLFADGHTYAYTPKEVFANTSFAILLKGQVVISNPRRGIARLFKGRERIYGDAALLQRLQTKDLQNVRYEQPAMGYRSGPARKRFLPAITYTNPTNFTEIRGRLNRIAQ